MMTPGGIPRSKVAMDGIVILVLIAFFCAIGLRRLAGRLGLGAPTYTAVFVVFLLAVLAWYGTYLE